LERTRVHVHRYAGDAVTTRKRFFLRGGFVAAMQEGDQRGLLARLTSSAREGFGDQQRAGASWMRADGNVFSHSAAQCRAVQRRDVQPPLAAQMPGVRAGSVRHACVPARWLIRRVNHSSAPATATATVGGVLGGLCRVDEGVRAHGARRPGQSQGYPGVARVQYLPR
jgi:hypothetical protein